MTTLHTRFAKFTLRLGVFALVSFLAVQGQTGAATLPTNKPTAPKTTDKKPLDTTPNTPAGANPLITNGADASALKPSMARPLGNMRIEAIAADDASFSSTGCTPAEPKTGELKCEGKAFPVTVTDPGLRAQLKTFQVGDVIRAEINDKGELADLRGALSIPGNDQICATKRFLVLVTCALVIFGLATAVTKGAPLKFIIGMDNRYSNSKFQFALWFWVALSTYLAAIVFRVWFAGWDFLGGVNIPQNLLVLSGLSAVTYGGAKAITTSKVNAAMNPTPTAVAVAPAASPAAAVVVDPGANAGGVAVAVAPVANPAPAAIAVTATPNMNPKNAQPAGNESFFEDLVQNDVGSFDFGDFQMLMVTFIAVAMYLSLIFHFLGSIEFVKTTTLPDVDTTILAGFGIGQGAYLAKKAGGNVGTS
jgi:hypothetical protein